MGRSAESKACRRCESPKNSEGCRHFRIYWRASTGKVRWKCLWSLGALEFEYARAVPESEN